MKYDVRFFCGLMMFQKESSWVCVDSYSRQIKYSGTYEECETYFNNYIAENADRD